MKLLVTDLDGTLLMTGGVVHPDDVLAARALRANGVHVSVATGRLYSGTRRYCRELGLAAPGSAALRGHHGFFQQGGFFVVPEDGHRSLLSFLEGGAGAGQHLALLGVSS